MLFYCAWFKKKKYSIPVIWVSSGTNNLFLELACIVYYYRLISPVVFVSLTVTVKRSLGNNLDGEKEVQTNVGEMRGEKRKNYAIESWSHDVLSRLATNFCDSVQSVIQHVSSVFPKKCSWGSLSIPLWETGIWIKSNTGLNHFLWKCKQGVCQLIAKHTPSIMVLLF